MRDGLMKLVPWKLDLSKLNGRLAFTESTTDAKDIRGVLFNKPFQFDLTTKQKSKTVSVVEASFSNRLTVADLQNWLKLPYAKLIRGTTNVDGTINFSLTEPLEIKLHSNLEGVSR